MLYVRSGVRIIFVTNKLKINCLCVCRFTEKSRWRNNTNPTRLTRTLVRTDKSSRQGPVGRRQKTILRESESYDSYVESVLHGIGRFKLVLSRLLYPINYLFVSKQSTNMENDLDKTVKSSEAREIIERTLTPPKQVKGMKTLNVDAFKKAVYVPAFRVSSHHVGKVSKVFKNVLLKMPRIQPIAEIKASDLDHETHRLILLNPDKIDCIQTFEANNCDFLASCHVPKEAVKLYELELGYENWTHHEVLRAILPDECNGVAGYSSIGHILHVNLREDAKDYKYIIGAVLLSKISSARTVVNKLDIIDNTFRNFEMEVLAGDNDLIAETKEHGHTYKLDFSKVYWNTRLGTEHQRIASTLRCSDVLLDVFAGIGPFSVPAAKKGCTVYANDLNPHSYHWLQENMTLNKVRGPYMTYNLDGRVFMTTVIKEKLLHHWQQDSSDERYHIVMNLPAMAVQFLDVFPGLFNDFNPQDHLTWPNFHQPRVYCYCFTKAEDGKADVVDEVEEHLGARLGSNHAVRFVRNVAPSKDMFCVMFTLTTDLLFGCHQVSGDEPLAKKQKADTSDS